MSRLLKVGHRGLCAGVLALLLGSAFSTSRLLSHGTTTNTVQFDREIVEILDSHCVSCHAEAGPAFSLETYEDTWLKRQEIHRAVLTRHMPPWRATSGNSALSNDNGLTLRERQFLVSWVEGLGPRNAGIVFWNVSGSQGAPPEPVRANPGFDRWRLGEPTLLLRLATLDPTTVEPGQPDAVRRFVVDPGLTEEQWISGLEYQPADRRVVRAAVFTVQDMGLWLGSWTPWHGFVELPETVAYRLPPGSRIAAEIHYRPSSDGVREQAPVIESMEDWGTLGLFLADGPALHAPGDLVLEVKGDVPAGAASERFRAETRLPAETHILSLRPDVKPGVSSIEVSARTPNGGTDVLLFARDIPVDWPTPYIFENTVRLPAGTRLSVTAYYTNASEAPQPGGVRLTVSRY